MKDFIIELFHLLAKLVLAGLWLASKAGEFSCKKLSQIFKSALSK